MQYMEQVWSDGEVLVRVSLADLATIERAVRFAARDREFDSRLAAYGLADLVQGVADAAREDLDACPDCRGSFGSRFHEVSCPA